MSKSKIVNVINGKLMLHTNESENPLRLVATHLTSKDVVHEKQIPYRHVRDFSRELLDFEREAIDRVNEKSSLDWPFDLAGWH